MFAPGCCFVPFLFAGVVRSDVWTCQRRSDCYEWTDGSNVFGWMPLCLSAGRRGNTMVFLLFEIRYPVSWASIWCDLLLIISYLQPWAETFFRKAYRGLLLETAAVGIGLAALFAVYCVHSLWSRNLSCEHRNSLSTILYLCRTVLVFLC